MVSRAMVVSAAAPLLLLVACGSADETSAPANDVPIEDGNDEVVASTLRGTYGGGNYFGTLSFEDGGKFVAVLNPNLRCITTPCPNNERVDGTYRVGKTTFTLSPSTPGHEVGGRYSFELAGSKLTVSRRGLRETLERAAPPRCAGLDEDACRAKSRSCTAIMGPSVCSRDGICTADEVFKRCEAKP